MEDQEKVRTAKILLAITSAIQMYQGALANATSAEEKIAMAKEMVEGFESLLGLTGLQIVELDTL